MGMLKYFGEQGDNHGGPLFWSNTLNGLPFRGPNAPTLRQEDLDKGAVQVVKDFHGEFFDLTDVEQNKRYHWVMDRLVNGSFCHHFIDRHVDHAAGKVTVYIEWSQRYGQLSPQAQGVSGSQSHAMPVDNSGLQSPAWANGLAGMQSPSSGMG